MGGIYPIHPMLYLKCYSTFNLSQHQPIRSPHTNPQHTITYIVSFMNRTNISHQIYLQTQYLQHRESNQGLLVSVLDSLVITVTVLLLVRSTSFQKSCWEIFFNLILFMGIHQNLQPIGVSDIHQLYILGQIINHNIPHQWYHN